MNFLQKLSNYFFGRPKIESAPAAPAPEPVKQPDIIVTPMFIRPEEVKKPEPAPLPPAEFPMKQEVKLETKEPAPEVTVTVQAPTVEVAPEPKKKRAPAKKKATAKKK